MATTRTSIVQRAKSILYSYGIGEHPVIVEAAADAAETIAAPKVTFTMASGEGGKIKPGDIMSTMNCATETAASEVYVLSANSTTEVVIAVASYNGAPAAAADAYDGALFEIGASKSEYFLFKQVDAILNAFLWPDIYKYNSYSITPDLATYQNELNAAVEEIEAVYQNIADFQVPLDHELAKNLPTSVSSTGVLATIYAIDGSSVYLKTRERFGLTDTFSDEMVQCIATGAAALAVGASRAATNMESASKDSQFRGQRNPASDLWREFITLKGEISADIAHEVDWFEYRR